MKESHGIKNTKEVIKLGSDIANILKQAKENDGKIDMADLPLLMGLSNSIGPAVQDIDMVIPEFKDLDSEEAKELIEYLGSELEGKFTDKEIIKKIEASIQFALAVNNLIKAF